MEIKKKKRISWFVLFIFIFIFLIVLGLFCYSKEMKRISIYEFEGNPESDCTILLIDRAIQNDPALCKELLYSENFPVIHVFGSFDLYPESITVEQYCRNFGKVYVAVRSSSSDLIHYLEELSAQQ